jgi:hypothetical protein
MEGRLLLKWKDLTQGISGWSDPNCSTRKVRFANIGLGAELRYHLYIVVVDQLIHYIKDEFLIVVRVPDGSNGRPDPHMSIFLVVARWALDTKRQFSL